MNHAGGTVAAISAPAEVDSAAEPSGLRTLLTVAVRDYEDEEEGGLHEEFAEGIDEQVDVVAQWWGPSGSHPGFHQVPAPDLRSRDDVEDFLREHDVREMQGLALVMFITGHGISGSSDAHFLKLPRSVDKRPLATAVRTSDVIAAALDSHVRNVLVIVNTCYAGSLRTELDALFKNIRRDRRRGCRLDVIATCGHDQAVQVRKFPTLLRAVYQRLQTSAGITTRHLTVADFLAEYEKGLRTEEERHVYRLHHLIDGSGHTFQTPCLPNPGFVDLRSATGAVLDAATAADYWVDRATGRTHESDAGWYFRGREEINRRIAAFLAPTRERGVLLVTGTVGSGKSAVLARAVVLSDVAFRQEPLYKEASELTVADTIPTEGAVSAAVLAHRRDAAQVAADILQALGTRPEPATEPADDPVVRWSRQIVAAVRSSGKPVTIVIDGLDESVECSRILRDVLEPLAEFCSPTFPGQRQSEPSAGDGTDPSVRLILGVRSSRPLPSPAGEEAKDEEHGLLQKLRQLFPSAEVARTDGDDARTDIEEYLSALISSGGKHDEADGVARRIAPLITPSFIDARLAGEQLRASPAPAAMASNPAWQAKLKLGIRGLLQRDLETVEEDGLPADVALALLRAAAFAQGAGVPWSDIWPNIAGVFLKRRLALDEWDLMIEKLLTGRLSGYLAHDHEDDRRVYRPAHEALTSVLQNTEDDLLDHEGTR
ncbi:ATP-binding protein [Streptomyces sp. NPDC097704]|uniref:ATP-binding protein n=1 Tax=Streptomyces sp. NPDC097704 TaxID=3157101 RepID=UPI00331A4AF8